MRDFKAKHVIGLILFVAAALFLYLAAVLIQGCGSMGSTSRGSETASGGSGSSGNVIQVSPGSSIQAAINSAQDGYTVEILPGTYTETIDLSGKRITLRSSDPTNSGVVASTIIDGGGNGPVIKSNSGASTDIGKNGSEVDQQLVVWGVTIMNGNAARGGGFSLSWSSRNLTLQKSEKNKGSRLYSSNSAVISNCVINDCGATEYGGGLYLEGCVGVKLENNTFRNNFCQGSGGGVAQFDCYDTISTGNIFEKNAAVGKGGGFFHTSQSVVLPQKSVWIDVENCTFKDNHSGDVGGGAYQPVSSAKWNSSLFQDNTAGLQYTFISVINSSIANQNITVTFYDSGGQAVASTSSAVASGSLWRLDVTDCTFSNNKGGGNGGGIGFASIEQGALPHDVFLNNNTITGNSCTTGKGGGLFIGTGWQFIDTNGNVIPPATLGSMNSLSGNTPDDIFVTGGGTGSVSGTVTCAQTGDPLSGATVTIGDKSTQTSALGAYTLSGIPEGNQNITASAPLHLPYSSSVNVTAGQTTVHNIQMQSL